MFRHIVLWTFPEENRPGVNRQNAVKIKTAVEELRYLLKGIIRLEVIIDPLPTETCNADIMIDGEFASREDFDEYLEHPRLRAVRELVAASVDERLCMDYEYNA